jgi:protein SCO1/2
MIKNIQYKLLLVAAIIALIIAATVASKLTYTFSGNTSMPMNQNKLKTNGFILPRSLPLANVNFNATQNEFTSTRGFEDQWTLLSLGFTECPSICPTTLMKLNQVVAGISEKITPQVAFLSIDIKPKEINKLTEYINYFNSDFVGLSTDTPQLDSFFKSIGANYSINKDTEGGLDIQHSTSIYLISPDGDYVANFPYMLSAKEIIDDYELIRTQ